MSDETKRCPQCGEVLAGGVANGLCPRCLMKEAMESTVGIESAGEPFAENSAAGKTALSPGEIIGSYRIVQMLGKGGMGTVYEAEHTDSGRHVALKVLGHGLQSSEHRQRFLREGRLAAAINHPNTVYIYGTELIDDIPVISMELARGGTLQERVKRIGPLQIGEAVDIILEIIAGLEAAETAGVLHRDVKPSNCFVDADSSIKVGDFGLSISTRTRGETNLTESGLFLGTPAFSSPEQLRGDELDVRSDIYSVGVTLFYLLTGQTPFHARQMVQLLATVLDRPAPSPKSVRPDIPRGLAKVVLRCLAKQSKDRFSNYDELRDALLAYRSQAPIPGTVGFRVLAYAIDAGVLLLIAGLLALFLSRDLVLWYSHFDAISDPAPRGPGSGFFSALGVALQLVYFAVAEGFWGATVGKSICRLRVVGPDREVASLARAAVRAIIFLGPAWIAWWLFYAAKPQTAVAAAQIHELTLVWIPIVISGVTVLLTFCSARRSNGYAGLHEFGSGTRTVRLPSRQQRPVLSQSHESTLPDMQEARVIGPYHMLAELDRRGEEVWVLGYDTKLLRQVWIRRSPVGSEDPPRPQREMARIGRLRWLSAGEDQDGRWDAYEGPKGKPLLKLVGASQPWDSVRFWLLDLARELRDSLNDGSFPETLELDRVWITADGRAKLLDFPAPGVDKQRVATSTKGPVDQDSAIGCFLKRVAVAALEGQLLSGDALRDREVSALLPPSAKELLSHLDQIENAAVPIDRLESFTTKPASVSLERRVGVLIACWLPPLMMVALTIPIYYAEMQFIERHPEVGKLAGYVNYYDSLSGSDPDDDHGGITTGELKRAIEIVAANRFRALADEVWSEPMAAEFVSKDGQQLLQRFANERPNPPVDELAAMRSKLKPFRDQIAEMGWSLEFYRQLIQPTGFLQMFFGTLIAFVVLPSLMTTLFLGSSLLLRVLEISLVTKSGARASRLRVLWRNALLWTVVLAAVGLLVYLIVTRGRPRLSYLLVICAIGSMFTSERGFHDRFAGTWMVPR